MTAPLDWRSASSDELLAHLASLDLGAFEEALHNPAFSEEHVRVALTEPGLSSQLLDRISREPRFFKKSSIRVGLLLHAKLPRVRGLELVPYLYWRDLIRVAAQPKVHPQVRVIAEQLLAERVPDLTLGEKIAVARTSGRMVLRVLRKDPEPRVIEALLRNYRCTEEDAVFIAASSDTTPQVLAVLARQEKWRQRPAVRSQLVRNRRLSLPLALGLLSTLSQGDLSAITRAGELPRLLRDAAARLMKTPEPRTGGRSEAGRAE